MLLQKSIVCNELDIYIFTNHHLIQIRFDWFLLNRR